MAKKQDATATKPATAPRAQVDWERIEPDWRAGIKSVLQIAADYEKATGRKVSHTAINKHFKALKQPRDLKAKVKAKADALVAAAMVSEKVSTETTPSDATIINETGAILASVQLSQRKDIQRGRKLTMSLLEELEGQCDNPQLLKDLGAMLYAPDEQGRDKLNDLYQKVISMPGRVDSMKKLADTLKTLVGLEREAYGLGDDGKNGGGGSLEDWLDTL